MPVTPVDATAAATTTPMPLPDPNMPNTGQLQPPAPTPNPPSAIQNPGLAAQPDAPPPGMMFKHLSNSFMGAVLGTMAGREKINSYQTDADGKMTPNLSQKTSGDQLRDIARAALQGLAAGAAVPQQKSSVAAGLAGLGAGAENQIGYQQQQDLLKRKQATEDFEHQQQQLLNRSAIARQNALTLGTYFENKKTINDMTPAFKEYGAVIDALKQSPEFAGHVQEMTGDQVMQMQKADPHFSSTHIVKPLGWAPVLDDKGEPITDADNKPQMYMRMGVVDGTVNGQIPITPDLAQKIKEYGPLTGLTGIEGIQSGQSYDFNKFLPLLNHIDEAQKNVMAGWRQSILGTDKDGKPVEINAYDKIRSRPFGGVTPLAVGKEQADVEEKRTAANKNTAEASKAFSEALLNRSLVNGGGPQGMTAVSATQSDPQLKNAYDKMSPDAQTVVRNANPQFLKQYLSVAFGDEDPTKVFPTTIRKGTGQQSYQQAEPYIKAFNPNFTMTLYTGKQRMQQEYNDPGKGPGLAINSFNQFLDHAAEAANLSNALQNTNSKWLNTPINTIKKDGLGDPGVPELMTAIQAARSEWQNFIKSGRASDIADTNDARALMSENSSPAAIRGALGVMASQAVDRLNQLNDTWKQQYYEDFPNLIHTGTQQAANTLGIGDKVAQYKSGGHLRGVMPRPDNPENPAPNPTVRPPAAQSGPPPGATYIVPGPDGKNHYTNAQGTQDLGIAP
jgi:hypothetical protein